MLPEAGTSTGQSLETSFQSGDLRLGERCSTKPGLDWSKVRTSPDPVTVRSGNGSIGTK